MEVSQLEREREMWIRGGTFAMGSGAGTSLNVGSLSTRCVSCAVSVWEAVGSCRVLTAAVLCRPPATASGAGGGSAS